ncbi:MAG: nitroreductase family protein [Spirochaetales bacterium]|nr:nitroreductase family protein [Spirochaetales bacterium]
MNIIKEINNRRAYRAISPEPVEREILTRITEAASLAPSCMNKQPWRFLILDDQAALEKGRSALSKGNYWAQKAPILVLVLTKKDLDCALNDGRDYALFDTGMAVMNLQLQAVAEGLHVHPMAGFDPAVIKKEFGITAEWIVVTVLAAGWPGTVESLSDAHREMEMAPRQRKPIEEIAAYNRWNEA